MSRNSIDFVISPVSSHSLTHSLTHSLFLSFPFHIIIIQIIIFSLSFLSSLFSSAAAAYAKDTRLNGTKLRRLTFANFPAPLPFTVINDEKPPQQQQQQNKFHKFFNFEPI